MIVLNEDGKSFVEITCWEDITSRPGYEEKVDKDEVKLKTIIGKYRLTPKQPCGISSCGTAHNRGYLVVCEGGVETNIGHDCGKNIFGVDFKTLENKFNQDTNAQRYREKIKDCQIRLDDYTRKIESIKTGEHRGQWCYEKMHWQMTRGFQNHTLDALQLKAKLKENRIFKLREMDAREIELARETGSKETYEKVQIGIILGISAVTEYKKLRTLLNINLGDEFNQFSSVDADVLNFTELQRWNNWVNRLDKRIQKVESIITDCLRFLSESNIDTIRKLKTYLHNT